MLIVISYKDPYPVLDGCHSSTTKMVYCLTPFFKMSAMFLLPLSVLNYKLGSGLAILEYLFFWTQLDVFVIVFLLSEYFTYKFNLKPVF